MRIIRYLYHITKIISSSAYTGFLSEIGTKLRDWAVGQAGAAATLGQRCPQMTQRRCSVHCGTHVSLLQSQTSEWACFPLRLTLSNWVNWSEDDDMKEWMILLTNFCNACLQGLRDTAYCVRRASDASACLPDAFEARALLISNAQTDSPTL